MRAIAPRTGAPEFSLATDQLEYKELTAAGYINEEGHRITLTRWTLDEEERQRVLDGEDVYIALLTYGNPMQPIMVQIGEGMWNVEP